MKTKESIQKTIVKVLACTIGLLVLAINVQAQKHLGIGLNDNANPTLIAMFSDTEWSPESIDAGVSTKGHEWAILLENETEESLELESWMVNSDLFNVKVFETEEEESLKLEDWMKNENHFEDQKIIIGMENERKMELESWMTSINIWK